MPLVAPIHWTITDNLLGRAFDSTVVSAEFRGIGTPGTLADEELRVRQMSQPLGSTPQRIRVRYRQMLSGLDRHVSGPHQQVAVARERLRAIWQAAMLQHGTLVVNSYVRWVGQRYLVAVNLHYAANPGKIRQNWFKPA